MANYAVKNAFNYAIKTPKYKNVLSGPLEKIAKKGNSCTEKKNYNND